MSGRSAREGYARRAGERIGIIGALIALLILLAGVAATLGAYPIGVAEVYRTIIAGPGIAEVSEIGLIVWQYRLPRVLMAILAGAALGLAGAVMQGILKNPLASPFTLGIASAASFGAALAIVLGAGVVVGGHLIAANAFLFTLLAAAAVYGLAQFRGITPETMIMAGIAIMYLFSALTSFLQYTGAAEDVHAVVFWMLGSLGRSTWETVTVAAAALILTVPLFLYFARSYNTLAAGDEAATSLGVAVGLVRVSGMAAASLLTAAVICFTGTIGFIGLVAPHTSRMIVGGDHRFLLPATAVMGALVLLAADSVGRTVTAPQILPVGVMTAFLGVPFFIFLFMRRRRDYW